MIQPFTLPTNLTSAGQQRINELIDRTQFNDSESLLAFGQDTQQQLADFSNHLLLYTKRQDITKISDILQRLTQQLQTVNIDEIIPEKTSFLHRFFKPQPSIQQTMTQLQKLAVHIERLRIQLEFSYNNLLQDINKFESTIEQHQEFYDELIAHISVLQYKKQQIITLPSNETVKNDDLLSNTQFNRQMLMERLDQRLYDLQLSEQIALQTSNQMQMIHQINHQLAEKIQSSILVAIPLWKNQLSMLSSLQQQHRLTASEKQFLEATNDFLTKQHNVTQHTTQTIANEKQRKKEELATLKATHHQLLQVVNEALQIADMQKEEP